MSATFAYVAGSSFVLQNVYGLSPELYGLCIRPQRPGSSSRVLRSTAGSPPGSAQPPCSRGGLTVMLLAGAVLLTIVTTGALGLPGVIPALFAVMFGSGFVGPELLGPGLTALPSRDRLGRRRSGLFPDSVWPPS